LLLLAGSVNAKPVDLPDWLLLDAEYRVQGVYLDPIELSGNTVEDMWYLEQRLRVDTGVQVKKVVKIMTQLDILGGVLFGDNGDFGQDPEPGSGLALTSKWPNNSTWGIGLLEDGDPLDPDGYGPVLRGVEPIRVNRVWAEVMLPVGVLRVGRQPAATSPGMTGHDGSRSNRWGVSRFSPTADRIFFATKISEIWRIASEGADYVPDRSLDKGVFLAAAYDHVVNDDIQIGSDDLHQAMVALQWKAKDPTWGNGKVSSFLLQAGFGGRWGDEFNTQVFSVPVTLEFTAGPVHFLGEFAALFGHSREISEGFAALRQPDESMRNIYDQKIRGYGARAILDMTFGPVTTTLEFDYASGDADPRDETTLRTFSFARDTNVGLLLFEHVLAFETARSAAVGIRNLRNLGTDSFPLTELATDGRFHNAIVLFPQVLYKPHDTVGIRFGTMIAWAAAPAVDPVMTLLAEDGKEIDDDAVNWHGGTPARFYGTELDLQVEWAWKNYFLWTVEGAVLFPGDALKDESGNAVTGFLVENRFTFLF